MRFKFRGAILIAVLAAAFAAAALAKTKATHDTLKTAQSASLGETIVVDGKGRTVYELRPETTHHLLCTSKACLGFWPPVTVHSAKTKLAKATGIKGKLGILHRDGFFQVTLGGVPLYRFSEDTMKGQANGQGIMNFGGTWHVVTASSHTSSPVAPPSGTTTTTPGYY